MNHNWRHHCEFTENSYIDIQLQIKVFVGMFMYTHQYTHNIFFPDGSSGKNLPVIQETQKIWVQFLSWEDPLEEGMATHSSILAWRIPMDRGAWWATAHGVAKSQTLLSTEHTHVLALATEKTQKQQYHKARSTFRVQIFVYNTVLQ